jgi:hypothetical protein
MKKELMLQVGIFIILSIAFYFLWGPSLILIFAIIWVDKSLLPHLKFSAQMGLELTTVAVILTGAIYGPVFGFLFAFFFVALVGGILNLISWKVSRPPEVEWPPLIPSPDHLIDGMIALLSGLLISVAPFLTVSLVCILVKTGLASIKERFMAGYVNIFARAINIVVSLFIIFYFQDYFLALIPA